MTFEELYIRILPLWPDSIDISDGKPTGGDGYLFVNLSNICKKIGDEIDHENDHWGSIGVWSFFQVLHHHAKNLHKQGKIKLFPAELDKNKLDQYIRSNLDDEEWEEERIEYLDL